jgi:hypothetical protein
LVSWYQFLYGQGIGHAILYTERGIAKENEEMVGGNREYGREIEVTEL